MSHSNHPISERRLAANRANAQERTARHSGERCALTEEPSTGPRTAQGKARSSLNALRHGITGQVSIMTEEDRAAHDKFFHELIDNLEPEGPLELQFASSIAEDFWRLQRIRALENDILALGNFSDAADIDVDHPEIHTSLTRAQTFLDHSKDFERLTLYEQRISRSIEKNRKQLDELQEKRRSREHDEAPRRPFGPPLWTAEDEADRPPLGPLLSADQTTPPAEAPQVPEKAERTVGNGFVFSTAPGASGTGPGATEATHGARETAPQCHISARPNQNPSSVQSRPALLE